MTYRPPDQLPGESPAQWVQRVLADTSHHIPITENNIVEWLFLDCYRNRPWVLLTPRGTFHSDRLFESWVVPRRPDDPSPPLRGLAPGFGPVWPVVDQFWLSKIIWHSDEDGWVAEYAERKERA